jgi:NhaP-type Na+/H+ or K+/H+ antiporter
LHSVWSYIQYVCETTIFLLTGIIIGVNILDKSHIDFSDWVRMFIFFILMVIGRGIMVLTFFPILKLFGYGLSYK